jgi:hypothetical protein
VLNLNQVGLLTLQLQMVLSLLQQLQILEIIEMIMYISNWMAEHAVMHLVYPNMVDVHILIIAIYHIKENALNANIILF